MDEAKNGFSHPIGKTLSDVAILPKIENRCKWYFGERMVYVCVFTVFFIARCSIIAHRQIQDAV